MPRKKSVNKEAVETVATTTFEVLPLLRKKLLRMDVVQAEHNMPMSHVQVLAMLGDAGAMSVTDISRHLGMAKPNITPLIDRLIREGYVERRRDTGDRRVVNVVICEKGRERLADIYRALCDNLFDWTRTLSQEDMTAFNEALETIVRLLRKQPEA